MPGLPHERDRAFFSARNLLERKHLGDFLSELGQLEVGGPGRCAGAAVQAPRRPLPPANSPPFALCAALLQGPLAGPAKPPELIKFNTAQTVGEAMKVRRKRAVPPTPGPPRVLLAPLSLPPPAAWLAQTSQAFPLPPPRACQHAARSRCPLLPSILLCTPCLPPCADAGCLQHPERPRQRRRDRGVCGHAGCGRHHGRPGER